MTDRYNAGKSGPTVSRTDRYGEPGSSFKAQQKAKGTDRYPGAEGGNRTEDYRQRNAGLTFRGEADLKFPPLDRNKEKIIDGRYQIVAGPLGGKTGEAEVFRCLDLEEESATVAVKLYRIDISPDTAVLDQLISLHHDDLVQLFGYGQWQGRFYEVMEFCAGGSMAEQPALSEEKLQPYLVEIANGLQYLHTLNIVHQDVKPGNFFFREENCKDLVIGDFGISARFDPFTGTCSNMGYQGTIDVVAPEIILRREASPRSDFYSLGLTILHLLLGHSPFEGRYPAEISGLHVSGEIPLPDTLSEHYRSIVLGLTQYQPENRWGYRQIQAWSKGEPILADDGTPWKVKTAHKDSPYPGCPTAKNPKELARAIGTSEFTEDQVAKDLYRGDIRQWIYIHFSDAALANRIEHLEEIPVEDAHMAVQKLRYLLDPTLPLIIDGQEIHDFPSLIEILEKSVAFRRLPVIRAFQEGRIEAWLEGATPEGNDPDFVQSLRMIRKQYAKDPDLGQFCLLYFLAPESKLFLDKDHSVSGPLELVRTVFGNPGLQEKAEQMLYGHYFEVWLQQAKFEDVVPIIDHLKTCYAEQDRALGLNRFCWRLDQSLPFLAEGISASSPQQLVAFLDADTDSWQLGLRIVKNGWLRAWLVNTGQLTEPSAFDAVISDGTLSDDAKLETLLHFLDPELPSPQLVSSRQRLRAGSVQSESSPTYTVLLSNGGRGYLFGNIEIDEASGVFLSDHKIDGNSLQLGITIKPLGLPIGSTRNCKLIIKTNGGTVSIPINYKIVTPKKWILQSLAWGLVWGAGLGLFRLSIDKIGLLEKYPNVSLYSFWMEYGSMNLVENNGEIFWPLMAHAALFIVVLVGLITLIFRMKKK